MARSSDRQTGDAAIKADKGRVHSVQVITNGSADATLILYDDPDSADGIELARVRCKAADLEKTVAFARPIAAYTGIYADITGTGASYIVHFT